MQFSHDEALGPAHNHEPRGVRRSRHGQQVCLQVLEEGIGIMPLRLGLDLLQVIQIGHFGQSDCSAEG